MRVVYAMLPITAKLTVILKIKYISPLKKKRSKSKKSTAVMDHMRMSDHLVYFEDLKDLASSNAEFHLKNKKVKKSFNTA